MANYKGTLDQSIEVARRASDQANGRSYPELRNLYNGKNVYFSVITKFDGSNVTSRFGDGVFIVSEENGVGVIDILTKNKNSTGPTLKLRLDEEQIAQIRLTQKGTFELT